GSGHRVMDRRAFVAMIGGSVLAGSRAGEAQQAVKVWRIGFLSPYSADFDKTRRAALEPRPPQLREGAGKELVIAEPQVTGPDDRFPELAAELVRMKIDIFVVHGPPQAVRAAEQASRAIPVVFVANPDPVGLGLVSSLARPDGRVTGLSDFHSGLVGKRLELLKEAAPSISRVAVLHNATPMSLNALKDAQAAASTLRLTVVPIEIRQGPEPKDIDHVFTSMKRERAEALNVLFGAPNVHVGRVADLAIKHRLPTIGNSRVNTD